MTARETFDLRLTRAQIALLADALVTYSMDRGPLVEGDNAERLLRVLSDALDRD